MSGSHRDDHRTGTNLLLSRAGSFVPGWQSPKRTVCGAKKKDTFPCPFPGFWPGAKQEDQTYYMLNVAPDALAFRKATNARPRRPVPRSKRLLGSGVVVAAIPKSVIPVSVLVKLNVALVGS